MDVLLINPENTRKRKFCCDSCGIFYEKDEYKILFKAKKILYFEYENHLGKRMRLCHECLYNSILSRFDYDFKDKRSISLKIVDGEKSYPCRLYKRDNPTGNKFWKGI